MTQIPNMTVTTQSIAHAHHATLTPHNFFTSLWEKAPCAVAVFDYARPELHHATGRSVCREIEAGERSNLIIAVGDLALRFPNLLEPWTAHIYQPLSDPDTGAQRLTSQACQALCRPPEPPMIASVRTAWQLRPPHKCLVSPVRHTPNPGAACACGVALARRTWDIPVVEQGCTKAPVCAPVSTLEDMMRGKGQQQPGWRRQHGA